MMILLQLEEVCVIQAKHDYTSITLILIVYYMLYYVQVVADLLCGDETLKQSSNSINLFGSFVLAYNVYSIVCV